jgi:hypothetical protein
MRQTDILGAEFATIDDDVAPRGALGTCYLSR